uniref:Mobile element protein n=1 Tax=Sphingomonas sp. SH TaxID=849864 RepID=A0A0X9MIF0_9SPHN|nr:Mobile element protein [Sphingomonas sp. SH]
MTGSQLYRGFRYPREIISHVVWLYFRFSLSFRDIEELMASRGIVVTYETIRQWTLRFGQQYAAELRRRQPRRGDKMAPRRGRADDQGKSIITSGRAVDQDGHVLDVLVQSRRDRQAAKRFFRKLLKGLRYVPRVLITDKLKSYAAAKAQIMPGVEHRQHKGLNNRAELSHQPTRQRERQMRRYKSPRHAQRFLSAHGPINNVFRCQRNRLSAQQYRHVRTQAFSLWNEVTDVAKNA